MTGEGDGRALAAGMRPRGAVLLLIGLALAGCGGLDDRNTEDTAGRASRAEAGAVSGVDVAAPEVFQVAERGLWDGRPSLGGVWVAHPDATDPERVRIVNRENGQEVIGALFRRERDLPGPALQISSDAAEALGILAGAPTELEVTALRRREAPAAVEDPIAEDAPPEAAPAEAAGAPTGAELAVALGAASTPDASAEPPPAEALPEPAPPPVAVDPAAIEAVAQATAAILANAAAAPAPAAGEIATTTLDGAAPAASAVPADTDGALVQLGLFDVEANATAAAQSFAAQGLPAQVIPSGKAWRLVLGPAASEAEQASLLQAAVAAGFADAYLVSR